MSATFDMVRLNRSKKTVDLSVNTIKQYASQGLNLYKRGRAVFFSQAELAHFIKSAPLQAVNKPRK